MWAEAKHSIVQLTQQIYQAANAKGTAKGFLGSIPFLFAKINVDLNQIPDAKTDQNACRNKRYAGGYRVGIRACPAHDVDMAKSGKSADYGYVIGKQHNGLEGWGGTLSGARIFIGNRLAYVRVDPVKSTFLETALCQTCAKTPRTPRRPRPNPTARSSSSLVGSSSLSPFWPMCSPVIQCLMAHQMPAARLRLSALKTTQLHQQRPRLQSRHPHRQNLRLHPLPQSLLLRQQRRPRRPNTSLISQSPYEGGHLTVSAFRMSAVWAFPFCSAKDVPC